VTTGAASATAIDTGIATGAETAGTAGARGISRAGEVARDTAGAMGVTREEEVARGTAGAEAAAIAEG